MDPGPSQAGAELCWMALLTSSWQDGEASLDLGPHALTFFNFFHIDGTLGIVLCFFKHDYMCHHKEELLSGPKINLDTLFQGKWACVTGAWILWHFATAMLSSPGEWPIGETWGLRKGMCVGHDTRCPLHHSSSQSGCLQVLFILWGWKFIILELNWSFILRSLTKPSMILGLVLFCMALSTGISLLLCLELRRQRRWKRRYYIN